eukprot:297237-Alexandrium_andersonii.AAC.1
MAEAPAPAHHAALPTIPSAVAGPPLPGFPRAATRPTRWGPQPDGKSASRPCLLYTSPSPRD